MFWLNMICGLGWMWLCRWKKYNELELMEIIRECDLMSYRIWNDKLSILRLADVMIFVDVLYIKW